MSRDLGHRQKVDWAAKQLETLDQELRTFQENEPFTARAQIEPEAKIIRVLANPHVPVPAALSLLAGDIIHNTRGSLDHLLYSIASRPPKSLSASEKKSVQFPICTRRDDYFGEGKKKGQRDSRLNLVDREVRIAVDALQPHLDGDTASEHALAILNELSNMDKHRSILVAHGQGFIGGILIINPVIDDIPILLNTADMLPEQRYSTWETDAELLLIRCPKGVPRSLIDGLHKLDPFPFVHIGFERDGPGRGKLVVSSLRSIQAFIRDRVFPSLEPFL